MSTRAREGDREAGMRRYRTHPRFVMARQVDKRTVIRGLEGETVARPGEWLVRGPIGEATCVVPDDIFQVTYAADACE